MIYSKIGGGALQRPSNSLVAKFASHASQGDARMRTDAQVKFLYYPLLTVSHRLHITTSFSF